MRKVIIKNGLANIMFYHSNLNFKNTMQIYAMKYWYIISYKLIWNQKGLDAPIDIEKRITAFNDYIAKKRIWLDLD